MRRATTKPAPKVTASLVLRSVSVVWKLGPKPKPSVTLVSGGTDEIWTRPTRICAGSTTKMTILKSVHAFRQ